MTDSNVDSPGAWRVEALAAQATISVDTVRYYQKLGLLHPPERHGRVAIYDATHLERLVTIRRLSDEGFSLSQIERLLDGESDPLFGALQSSDRTVSFEQLVELSGFPTEIIELAVDAGLVRAVPTDPGRFDREAVTMLTAGSALLEAGLPLEELLGVAMRHAEHVETVVDEAIELFQRHLEPGERDRRADIVADLVPLVSDLVAGHFRQTLVDRASSRLLARDQSITAEGGHLPDETETPTPVHTTLQVTRQRVDPIDPLTVFHAAIGRPRAFWSIPDSGVTLAAVGESFAATAANSLDRFADVSAELGGLDLRVEGDSGPPEAGPLLLGGIGFSDGDVDRDPDWSAFGPARLVLPEFLVAETPDGTFLTTVGDAELGRLLDPVELPEQLGTIHPVDHRVDDSYEGLVERALESITDGELDKVVTARSLRIPGHLDMTVILDRLRHRFPNCATFAFSSGDQVFLGASPEQLVARRGPRVDTMAVAGTRPRHDHPGLDAQLRASLLASPKERLEHQMVVDDIRATLRNAGVELDPDADTGVLQLRRNQHLYTPVGGTLTTAASTLDLVAALHPTPAVAGLPRRESQDWIDEHESFDRGWYAAPVGWTTVDGTGEFRVALRSALLDADSITLFAGGGIVDGSVPSQELTETAVKFEALLGALGVTE